MNFLFKNLLGLVFLLFLSIKLSSICIAIGNDELENSPNENWVEYSLDDLIKEAINSNPLIKYYESIYLSKQAIIPQVKTLPEPLLSLSSQSMGTPIPFITLGDSIMDMISFKAEQEIPYPAKLKLQAEIAKFDSLSAKEDINSIKLSVINKVKQEYIDLLLSSEKLKILNKKKELLEELFQLAEARYKTGFGSLEDLFRIKAEISVIKSELAEVKSIYSIHIANINALLNRDPSIKFKVRGELREGTFNKEYIELVELLKRNNPVLKTETFQLDAIKKEEEIARKGYYPDFVINAGYGYIKGFDDMWSIEIGIKIPLYYKTMQKMEIAEAINKKESEKYMLNKKIQDLLEMLQEAYLKAKTSEELFAIYNNEIMPQSTAALEASIANYGVGKTDFISVINNFLTNLNYELKYYEQLASFYKAIADIEMLTASNFNNLKNEK
jgi:outer membrane protein TolC